MNTRYAAIFDMDGTLIDSDDFWSNAEQAVFTSVGVVVDTKSAKLTSAMTTCEVAQFWYEKYPWTSKSIVQIEHEVVDRVADDIKLHGAPLAGVPEVLEFFKSRGFSIGLATNSPSRLIPLVLERLRINEYFDAVASAESEVAGKPNPAIYKSVSRALNVGPTSCIVFEDSGAGLDAAKSANMLTVGVSQTTSDWESLTQADLLIDSLARFDESHLANLLGDGSMKSAYRKF